MNILTLKDKFKDVAYFSLESWEKELAEQKARLAEIEKLPGKSQRVKATNALLKEYGYDLVLPGNIDEMIAKEAKEAKMISSQSLSTSSTSKPSTSSKPSTTTPTSPKTPSTTTGKLPLGMIGAAALGTAAVGGGLYALSRRRKKESQY
jgi:hypothetical protein